MRWAPFDIPIVTTSLTAAQPHRLRKPARMKWQRTNAHAYATRLWVTARRLDCECAQHITHHPHPAPRATARAVDCGGEQWMGRYRQWWRQWVGDKHHYHCWKRLLAGWMGRSRKRLQSTYCPHPDFRATARGVDCNGMPTVDNDDNGYWQLCLTHHPMATIFSSTQPPSYRLTCTLIAQSLSYLNNRWACRRIIEKSILLLLAMPCQIWETCPHRSFLSFLSLPSCSLDLHLLPCLSSKKITLKNLEATSQSEQAQQPSATVDCMHAIYILFLLTVHAISSRCTSWCHSNVFEIWIFCRSSQLEWKASSKQPLILTRSHHQMGRPEVVPSWSQAQGKRSSSH